MPRNENEKVHSGVGSAVHSAVHSSIIRLSIIAGGAVGHVEHLAGDQMYIDYAGDKLEVVDETTGEVRSVEVFNR